MGVIDKNTGELRSTFDILQDLSKAWEHLTSVEKQELTETVAGKTQRSLFTAIMTNFQTAVDATTDALNSENSASEENAKRMDSLNGKLTQLQSAWQSFARDTIDSDFVKNILSSLTDLLKLIDSIGGLPTVLATATSALMLFKGGLILDKAFKAFTSGISSIGSGLTTLITALPNAIVAFRAFSAGIISAGTAVQAAAPLLSVIALAITGVVAGINAFTKAQKEATSAAIENSQEVAKSIKAKNEEKQKIEEEIQSLEKEKETYIENAKAKDEDVDNSDFIKSKNEEIQKRQENIDKIEEENKKKLEQREAAARSITVNTADSTGVGWNQLYGISNNDEETKKLRNAVKEVNKELEDAEGNTGKYNKKLEELRAKYNGIAKAREENGEKALAENEVIEILNKEIKANSEKYEEDKKAAEEFYDILKNGGNISEENISWLKDFLSLSDEQIDKLRQGVDVKNEDNNATQEQDEAQKQLNEAIEAAQQAQADYNLAFKDNIDTLANYQSQMETLISAQEELNNSGSLTAETFKTLSDNNLLQYLEETENGYRINTQALTDSANAAKETAAANLQAQAAEQIQAIILGELQGKFSGLSADQIVANTRTQEGGNNALTAAPKYLELASSVATAGNAYENFYKQMGGGTAGTPQYTGISNEAKNAISDVISQTNAATTAIKKLSLTSSSGKKTGSSKRKSGTGSSKSSSKASSKKTQEEYKAEIDLLYQYENALENAKDEVDRLKDSLGDTENFNEQEKYIRQLIDALNNQINKTNELKDAQASQIRDYINQLRQQGFSIDYNAEKNELYINNMQHLADFSGDTAKNLEKLIKKIQDLNKDNRSLDSSIRDLRGNVKDYYDQLADIPEKKLKKLNELMKDFQQSQLDQIQNEIDDLNHALENDPRLKALEEQIEALEKQNDTIDKQKEMEEKLLAVEEARQKLANAKKNRTLQVFREGQGFVWESDPSAIKEAEEDLKNAQDALNEQVKNDQLEDLKNQKEQIEKSYQDQIDSLEKFLDEQNYIIDKANREGIQSFDDLRKKLAEFGLDSAENLKKASDWLNNYNQALKDLKNTATNTLSTTTLATNGIIYSSATQDRISQALVGMNFDMTTRTNTQSYDRITQGSNGQTIYINEIQLPNVKDVDDFVEALKDLPRLATTKSSLRK